MEMICFFKSHFDDGSGGYTYECIYPTLQAFTLKKVNLTIYKVHFNFFN